MGRKQTFGQALKHYRLGRGLTLRELRELTGFPEATLSRIENGRVSPRELTVAKIRRTLKGFTA